MLHFWVPVLMFTGINWSDVRVSVVAEFFQDDQPHRHSDSAADRGRMHRVEPHCEPEHLPLLLSQVEAREALSRASGKGFFSFSLSFFLSSNHVSFSSPCRHDPKGYPGCWLQSRSWRRSRSDDGASKRAPHTVKTTRRAAASGKTWGRSWSCTMAQNCTTELIFLFSLLVSP